MRLSVISRWPSEQCWWYTEAVTAKDRLPIIHEGLYMKEQYTSSSTRRAVHEGEFNKMVKRGTHADKSRERERAHANL